VPSTSSVTSAFLIGASGGSMLIPWLIGVLLERRGAGALPAVVLAGTLVCTVVVFAVASIGRAHYAAEN
jgi:fucose permease